MFVGAFVRPETFPHLKRYYHDVRNVYQGAHNLGRGGGGVIKIHKKRHDCVIA